ncbi:hypothetical protein BH11BAC4_BH11BAC4_06060 [soil metagenome]
MKRIIFTLLICLLLTSAFSQRGADSLVVKIDSLGSSLNIEKNTFIYIDSAGLYPAGDIPLTAFTPLQDFADRKDVPKRHFNKPLYLQFSLQNVSGTPQEFYFYPGMFYDNIMLYQRTAKGLEKIAGANSNKGVVYLKVPAGKPHTFLLKLTFSQTEYERIKAVIVNPDFLQNFIMELSNSHRDKRIASYILCGVLLMMILFTLVNYFLSYKIEFLYHCAFSVCMFFLIFFSSYLNRMPGWFTAFFMSYLDLIFLIVGTIFYLAFIRRFLDTKHNHVVLDKLFKVEAWILAVLMLVFTYVHFTNGTSILGMIIENSMKILALLIGTVFIVKGLRHKDRLMQYLAMGSAAQIFFSIISLLIILTGVYTSSLLTSALFYFELGIIMAVFFFLLGLAYKNRRDLIEKTQEQEATKLEVEKKIFETKLAVINAQQEERNRISADMHDDLGAGMTTIRLFSELAKSKMGDTAMPEIEKISTSANELLNKMNAIIWSMSSSNDTLGNMVAYIRSYALEYFDNTGIDCRIKLPDQLPELVVAGEIRRNVFLVVKEALNNIVKHSGATEVMINLQLENNALSLTIHDTGKGIDFEKIRQFGNGLKNMKKRMDEVGIEFYIENDHGTVVKLLRSLEGLL